MSIISESENIATMTANHYERILRERDEARELLASEKITRDHVIKRGIEMQKERDEAREALAAEIKHHVETTVKWNGHHMLLTIAQCDLNKALRERDEARADSAQLADRLSGLELRTTEELARMERERDEAREELQTELEMWRDGNILHENYRNELEKAERERDEAREENAKLRDIAERAIEKIEQENWGIRQVSEFWKQIRSELDQLKEGAK